MQPAVQYRLEKMSLIKNKPLSGDSDDPCFINAPYTNQIQEPKENTFDPPESLDRSFMIP